MIKYVFVLDLYKNNGSTYAESWQMTNLIMKVIFSKNTIIKNIVLYEYCSYQMINNYSY